MGILPFYSLPRKAAKFNEIEEGAGIDAGRRNGARRCFRWHGEAGFRSLPVITKVQHTDRAASPNQTLQRLHPQARTIGSGGLEEALLSERFQHAVPVGRLLAAPLRREAS